MMIPYYLLLVMRNIKDIDMTFKEYIHIAEYLYGHGYEDTPNYEQMRVELSHLFMTKEGVSLYPTLRNDVNIPIIPTTPKWSTPDPGENEQMRPKWMDNRLEQPILLPETDKDRPIQCKMEGISVQCAGSRPDWRPNVDQWDKYVHSELGSVEASLPPSLSKGTLNNIPTYYDQANGMNHSDGMISPHLRVGVIHCSLGCTYSCKYRARSTSNVLYYKVPSSLLIDTPSPTD